MRAPKGVRRSAYADTRGDAATREVLQRSRSSVTISASASDAAMCNAVCPVRDRSHRRWHRHPEARRPPVHRPDPLPRATVKVV